MIPEIDGIEVFKWIRKGRNPVIMLTAKGDTI